MSWRPRTSRLVALLSVADRQGGILALDEAASVLGVAPSEVVDEAARLSTLGVPPFDPDDHLSIEVRDGWVHIALPLALRGLLQLAPADVSLLVAALSAVGDGLVGEQAQRAERLIRRLHEGLHEELADEAKERASSIAWGASEPGDPEVVRALHAGVGEGRVLRIRYANASRDRIEERRVRPWRIVEHGGRWYLSADCLQRRAHRLFRVDRVLSVHVTDEQVEGEPPPETLYGSNPLYEAPDALASVEVRFDAEVVADARGWFDEVEELAADRLRLYGPTLPVLLRDLLAFGPGWEVVGPVEARERLLEWCARMG